MISMAAGNCCSVASPASNVMFDTLDVKYYEISPRAVFPASRAASALVMSASEAPSALLAVYLGD
jgi:hypothetical protein